MFFYLFIFQSFFVYLILEICTKMLLFPVGCGDPLRHGSSGIFLRNISSFSLNWSTLTFLSSRSSFGMTLNSLQPLIVMDSSLSDLIRSGAPLTIGLMTHLGPLLSSRVRLRWGTVVHVVFFIFIPMFGTNLLIIFHIYIW